MNLNTDCILWLRSSNQRRWWQRKLPKTGSHLDIRVFIFYCAKKLDFTTRFFFSRSLSIPSVGLSLSNYLSLNLPLVHSVIHSCSLCRTKHTLVSLCVFSDFFYPHFFKLFFFCWWSITWTKGEKKM